MGAPVLIIRAGVFDRARHGAETCPWKVQSWIWKVHFSPAC